MFENYLLMLAALFPVVNPPGSALVFLAMTKRASASTRRTLARRVSINAFFVMAGSLLIGTSILQLYGITVPVLRVAGGLVVAISGWRLLNSGSTKEEDARASDPKAEYFNQAFYPLTLPLTTGPGTIAVMISLGLTQSSYHSELDRIGFFVSGLLAILTIVLTVYFCFSFADWVAKVLGRGATDIAVRLSAFILYCLGVQIVWSGATELIRSLPTAS
jgi:multiple antibiotic resistance protein